MLQLTILREDEQILTMILTPGEYTVGRLEDNDITLDDRQVSRHHARIIVVDKDVTIEDMGSSNKLYLQGRKITSAALQPGKPVMIKPFTLSVKHLSEGDDKTMVIGGDIDDLHDQATAIMPAPKIPRQMKLVGVKGSVKGTEHVIKDGVTLLGRSEECGIHLQDPTASRRHAEIESSSGRILVRDLGSTLGTYVNDEKIHEYVLSASDIIKIGGQAFELKSDSGPAISKLPEAREWKPSSSHHPPHKPGGNGKRTFFVLLTIVIFFTVGIMFMSREPDKTQEKVQPEEDVQTAEMDQVQRLVTINIVRGKQAMESGQYEDAVRYLQKVVVADPDHEEGGRLLLKARNQLEQLQQERLRLEQEQQALDQKIGALLTDARKALESSNYSRAVEKTVQLLELNKDHAEAAEIKDKAEAAQLELQRREQQARAAARKLESDARQAFERGQSYRQQGNLVQAVRAWENLLQIDSRRRTEYPAEAEKMIQQVKQELSSRSESIVAGAADQIESDPRLAYQELQRALRIDPWNARAAQLIKDVQQKLVVQARDLFNEGRVLESLGDINQACEKWRTALEWVPESDSLHQRIKSKEEQCR